MLILGSFVSGFERSIVDKGEAGLSRACEIRENTRRWSASETTAGDGGRRAQFWKQSASISAATT